MYKKSTIVVQPCGTFMHLITISVKIAVHLVVNSSALRGKFAFVAAMILSQWTLHAMRIIFFKSSIQELVSHRLCI